MLFKFVSISFAVCPDLMRDMLQIYHKMTDPGAKTIIMSNLSEREADAVRRSLGESVLSFTPRNPTGRYHLDLLRKEEREVCR